MALIRTTLVNEIRAIIDLEYEGHAGFPQDNVENASRWATAINNYAQAVTPPSISSVAARSAFETVMLGMSAELQNGIPIFASAFTAYAGALAPGMQPNFTATPPPIPINIAPVIPVGVAGAPAQAIAETLATIIDTWFRTGLAINNSSGATVPWS